MSCGVGHRCNSNLLWLWLWPAAAAPIQTLAWELPYAAKSKKKKKKRGTLEFVRNLNFKVFKEFSCGALG